MSLYADIPIQVIPEDDFPEPQAEFAGQLRVIRFIEGGPDMLMVCLRDTTEGYQWVSIATGDDV